MVDNFHYLDLKDSYKKHQKIIYFKKILFNSYDLLFSKKTLQNQIY
jgi:hypothetical protein